MRVLVTGHLGYVGGALTPKLRAAGHDVVGLDSGLFRDGILGPAPPTVPNLACDLRDVTLGELRGFDAVVHLAGISNDPLGDLDPDVTYEINHQAAVRLARLAKQAGVPRFLFASSCSLYGAADDRQLLNESAPFKPITPYGHSKRLAERDIAPLADVYFTPTFLRGATAYGYSPWLRADLVVNNLTGHAVLEGQVLLKSDGSPWRPLVHVHDLALAYLAVLHAPRVAVHGEAFNVGRTDENYQIRDIAACVEQLVPGSRLRLAPGAGPDQRCYRVDCSKLPRHLPHYRPAWDLRRGIEQLADAYRQHGMTIDRFLGSDFLRLRRIQQLSAEGRVDATYRPLASVA